MADVTREFRPTPRLTRAEARRIAEAIVDDLFTAGYGHIIDRLQLLQCQPDGTERSLGAWSKLTLCDRITTCLLRVPPPGPGTGLER